MQKLTDIARRAIPLIDLTLLNDNDQASDIRALCRRASTPFGPVAALCVHPAWVALARSTLQAEGLGEDVAVATVVNFPHGEGNSGQVVEQTRMAVGAGAQEIDLVFPWRALLAGDGERGQALVGAVREHCPGRLLKVILETGQLADPVLIAQAAERAIAGGADFLKTSTGKVPVNATPQAAQILLNCIAERDATIGFKASGGIRTTAEAGVYLELADRLIRPGWATPARFRFGASSLLDDLLAHAAGTPC